MQNHSPLRKRGIFVAERNIEVPCILRLVQIGDNQGINNDRVRYNCKKINTARFIG